MVYSFPFALVLSLVLGFAALPLLASFRWRLFLFWLLHVVFRLGAVSLLFRRFFFFIPFPFVLCPWSPPGDCPFHRIVFAFACIIFSPSTSSGSSCVSVT